jgi:hypothetical protein
LEIETLIRLSDEFLLEQRSTKRGLGGRSPISVADWREIISDREFWREHRVILRERQ